MRRCTESFCLAKGILPVHHEKTRDGRATVVVLLPRGVQQIRHILLGQICAVSIFVPDTVKVFTRGFIKITIGYLPSEVTSWLSFISQKELRRRYKTKQVSVSETTNK